MGGMPAGGMVGGMPAGGMGGVHGPGMGYPTAAISGGMGTGDYGMAPNPLVTAQVTCCGMCASVRVAVGQAVVVMPGGVAQWAVAWPPACRGHCTGWMGAGAATGYESSSACWHPSFDGRTSALRRAKKGGAGLLHVEAGWRSASSCPPLFLAVPPHASCLQPPCLAASLVLANSRMAWACHVRIWPTLIITSA